MRLFIGIELPKSCKRTLRETQNALRAAGAQGRFVPGDSFHITLHFIGESNALSDAVLAMHEAVRGIRPFNLHLTGYTSFPRGESAVAAIKVGGETDELNALYESLQSALYDRGFSREHKRYVPHITLGRNVVCDAAAQQAADALAPNASLLVREIVLFESRREDGRMVYLPLHRERF